MGETKAAVERPNKIKIIGRLIYALTALTVFLGFIGLIKVPEIVQAFDNLLQQAGVIGISGAEVSTVLGIGGFILALVYLEIGIGFLKGLPVFWNLCLLFWILSLAGSFMMMAINIYIGVAGVVIYIVMLFLLFRPEVKAYFKK